MNLSSNEAILRFNIDNGTFEGFSHRGLLPPRSLYEKGFDQTQPRRTKVDAKNYLEQADMHGSMEINRGLTLLTSEAIRSNGSRWHTGGLHPEEITDFSGYPYWLAADDSVAVGIELPEDLEKYL